MQKTFLSTLVFVLLLGQLTQAQNKPLSNRVNLLFGLNQPLLGGFNIEGNLFYKRLVFDYSHGVSLNFSNATLAGDEKTQQLAVHIPYTTGFGVGYRFNEWFNLRAEPKWHRFELYYEGDAQTIDNRIVAYNTFSLGIGAYFNVRPFKNKEGFLKGIMIAPSIRYWPKLSDNLANNFTYQNRVTGQSESLSAMEVGVSNTPWIFNISIGYTFEY
ncbi:MAG TPA: hypothetical protein DCS93_38805 [Microscillaceae bacterium]|nr:hypothetical protein [Microscillaceae bacterium]